VLDDNTKSSSDLMSEWFGVETRGEWFPYPDKAVCPPLILMVMISYWSIAFSYRHAFQLASSPISRAQQKAVLSWAKELGAQVPGYTRFRKCQETLQKETGHPTTRQESGRGNVWYLNEVGDAIAKV